MTRSPLRCLALFAAILPFVLGTELLAQRTSDESHLGFQLRVPKGWEELPVQNSENYIVARFKHPRGFRGFEASIEVMRFERKNPSKKKSDVEKKLEEDFEASGFSFGNAPSYMDWLKRHRPQAEMGKPKKLKTARQPKGLKVEAVYRTGKANQGYSFGGRSMGDFVMFVGVYTLDTHEYAVEMSIHEGQLRKDRQLLLKTLRSMQFTKEAVALVAKTQEKWEEEANPAKPKPTIAGVGPDGQPLEEKDEYDRTKSSAQKFAEAKKRALDRAKSDLENVPGWWYQISPSERYIVVTNIDKTKTNNQMKVKKVLQVVEAMRDLYEVHFPPRNEITAVSIIRICKDANTYHQYGGRPGTAGYWYSVDEELVLYFEAHVEFTLAVLRHEAFHQYIFYGAGELSPHSWFNEGYGDYYAGAVVRGKKVMGVKPFKWRVDTIKEAARKKAHVPLKELVRYTQAQYYGNSTLCYAQGWSFVYFLREGIAKKDHPWHQILPVYFEELQVTKDMTKAVDKAFKDVDFEELEKAWRAFTISGKKYRG